MDFKFKPEHEMIRKTLADFVDNEVIPRARDFDEAAEFPRDLFQKVADMGFFGMRYPPEYGGCSADNITCCIFSEELGRGNMSLAAGCLMQALMGTHFVFTYGSEDIRQRLIVPAIKGEKMGVICFTEPDAGSDLGNIKTTARREGDEWVLNGAKTWITNAYIADFFTVVAMTGKGKGTEKVNFFLVEKDLPGVKISGKIDKVGVRAIQSAEVIMDEVRLPGEYLLGVEDRGMANLSKILGEIRSMTAALSVGLARAALDESIKYASERVCFGRTIDRFQGIQFKIADMATNIEASRLLTYKAACLLDQKVPCMKEVSMAKLIASETAIRCCEEAIRIHGSYGYSMDYPVQRYWRDAPFLLFGGGTSEILRFIISREMTRKR